MSGLLERLSVEFSLPVPDLTYLIRSAPYRYKVYEIAKKAPGKKRTIAQPARVLKPLQYWVMRNILDKFPIHPAATAYRVGRNIADNAMPHAQHRYLCKMDFRNFFPSIKSTDLQRFLAGNPFAPELSQQEVDFLTRILFWKDRRGGDLRLSIGAPSSPLVSNILLYRFDVATHALCSEHGATYTRYADDLTFSTNHPNVLYRIAEEIPKICSRLESPRLRLNTGKTVHASKKGSRRVTGLILTNASTVSIGRERKRQIRAAIHRYLSNAEMKPEEVASLAGTLAFIGSVEPAFLGRLERKYGVENLRRLRSGGR